MSVEKTCGSCRYFLAWDFGKPHETITGDCDAPIPMFVKNYDRAPVTKYDTGCPCHVEKEVE
jgi:hypothetical protein